MKCIVHNFLCDRFYVMGVKIFTEYVSFTLGTRKMFFYSKLSVFAKSAKVM